jgi:hypothetical protein
MLTSSLLLFRGFESQMDQIPFAYDLHKLAQSRQGVAEQLRDYAVHRPSADGLLLKDMDSKTIVALLHAGYRLVPAPEVSRASFRVFIPENLPPPERPVQWDKVKQAGASILSWLFSIVAGIVVLATMGIVALLIFNMSSDAAFMSYYIHRGATIANKAECPLAVNCFRCRIASIFGSDEKHFVDLSAPQEVVDFFISACNTCCNIDQRQGQK